MKSIFLDYGNTLVSFNPFEIVKSFGAEDATARTLSEIVFARKYFDRLDSGSITQEEFKKAVANETPQELIKLAVHICDNWIYHLPLIDGMAQLVSSLKRNGYKLYILSNISKNFADNADKIDIFRYCDGFVFSGEIKIVKPDREFFEYALKKFDVKPKEAVFIDDSEINIKGADLCGINTILFDGSADNTAKILSEKFEIKVNYI